MLELDVLQKIQYRIKYHLLLVLKWTSQIVRKKASLAATLPESVPSRRILPHFSEKPYGSPGRWEISVPTLHRRPQSGSWQAVAPILSVFLVGSCRSAAGGGLLRQISMRKQVVSQFENGIWYDPPVGRGGRYARTGSYGFPSRCFLADIPWQV